MNRASLCLGLALSGLWGVAVQAAAPSAVVPSVASPVQGPSQVDVLLQQENGEKNLTVAPIIDDWSFLRRVYVDLIGRIPSNEEIKEFQVLPAATRRTQLVEKLLAEPRFNDRWSVFFADMLRIRADAQGGPAFLAYVHKALREQMPYDAMCRTLISATGKANQVPEVGYILGDDVDPMALAGSTAQVFMGVRIACAQCHDHPFDVWKRDQFYGFAAYFGKTRRMVSPVTETLYTTEADETSILWPPDDPKFKGEVRKPVTPSFPFTTEEGDRPSKPLARLAALRAEQSARADALNAANKKLTLVDDLLTDAEEKVKDPTTGKLPEVLDVKKEVREQTKKLNVLADIYRPSELRKELGQLVTDPRNRFFPKVLLNRLWKDLVGRGFVMPIDDFSEENQPSHPLALDYLADEFIASGYDFRHAVRLVVTSQAYQRGHLKDSAEQVRIDAEAAFVATPLRRMLAESLYDSISQAGHVANPKYVPGSNKQTIQEMVQIVIQNGEEVPVKSPLASVIAGSGKPGMAMKGEAMASAGGAYDLEKAIELDFDKALTADSDAPAIDAMKAMSKEELEAQEMLMRAANRENPNIKYEMKMVEREIDVNPAFASAMRMASPANPSHFLRIFGQPPRDALGDQRDNDANMRQALMMLNGALTHEASRVGNLEPVYKLLVGEKKNLAQAVKLVYREILTREPSAQELADAQEIIGGGGTAVEGMSDLRWVLLNGHEFRFLP